MSDGLKRSLKGIFAVVNKTTGRFYSDTFGGFGILL